jgi:hypothetical protein
MSFSIRNPRSRIFLRPGFIRLSRKGRRSRSATGNISSADLIGFFKVKALEETLFMEFRPQGGFRRGLDRLSLKGRRKHLPGECERATNISNNNKLLLINDKNILTNNNLCPIFRRVKGQEDVHRESI